LKYLQDVVRQIENNPTRKPGDKPIKEVKIVDSGSEPVPQPFAVAKGDATE
jgi:hypothetical protein